MPKRKLLFLLLLPCTVFCQQYLTPDSIELRNNKVRKLTVLNCLDSSNCFKDEFEYNRQGQITKNMPGIVGGYSEFDYYDNGQLKTYYSKMHTSGSDSLFIVDHYYYGNDKKFKRILSDHYQESQVVFTDTLTEQRAIWKPEGERDAKGRIIRQQVGDLYFPCGIIFKGRHTIQYVYDTKGLLTHAKVYNDGDKVIVNFSYAYEFY